MLRPLSLALVASLGVYLVSNVPVAYSQSFPGVPGLEARPGIGAQLPIGQPGVVGPPGGTSVQLPTFSFFTISTTVLVPDSGGTFLGGVNSGAGVGRQNGAPGLAGSRAGGSGVNAGGISVGAQIHDLREMDRQLLAGGRQLTSAEQATNVWHARLDRAKQSTAGRPTISMAEARAAAAR
jgi:hypothetical protein